MRLAYATLVPFSLLLASTVFAQADDTTTESGGKPTDTATEAKPALLSPYPVARYTDGDFWSRSHATGDWNGKRNELAEQGFTFEVDVTQIFQANARGGADTNNGFRYSGSADYNLTLDTARLGWWPAGQIRLKGETQFGQSINGKVGSVMAVNADALFPLPDENKTTLTDVVLTQFFSEHFGIALGKIDFRGGDTNAFANSETTQFMNLGFLANPTILALAPYTALNASVILRPTNDLFVVVSALDSFGEATTSGFDTAFSSPRGTTLLNEWTFTVRPYGLTGHQRFGVVYSNKQKTQFDQDLRFGGPLGTLRSLAQIITNPETQSEDWALYYNFDQYLYVEKDDQTQGVGLFGRVGWSDGKVNPIEGFYSMGIGGKGIFDARDNDTFGLAYYYMDMSDDLPAFLGLDTEQGIELYYNIEVAPWLHLTPDIQYIIDPGGGNYDDALAVGLRWQMKF